MDNIKIAKIPKVANLPIFVVNLPQNYMHSCYLLLDKTYPLDLFRKLCALGEELVALHLLEAPILSEPITRYPIPGDNTVERRR